MPGVFQFLIKGYPPPRGGGGNSPNGFQFLIKGYHHYKPKQDI